MFCDICHNKQATIHFKHVSNNEIVEIHFCEDCAHEKGINLFTMEDMPLGEQQFALADLLAGFTDMPSSIKEKKFVKKCPNCGITYSDFKSSGRLGCSECYKSFRNQLMPLLKKLQGSTQHSGKAIGVKHKPEKLKKEKTLQELRTELRRTVDREEYEKAAVIRDRIKELESKKNKREG